MLSLSGHSKFMGIELQPPASVRVSIVMSRAARGAVEAYLEVPLGTPVVEAISRSGLLQGLPSGTIDSFALTVWGRKSSFKYVLRDGDRVELLRPLRVDPKVARRERFVKQGAKSAGLFAHRRTGSKAGY